MTTAALPRPDRLQAVADRIETACSAAGVLTAAARLAHLAACEDGGPMELLLREALADAHKLAERLALLGQFATEATQPKD